MVYLGQVIVVEMEVEIEVEIEVDVLHLLTIRHTL